jgi:hypothetical protein
MGLAGGFKWRYLLSLQESDNCEDGATIFLGFQQIQLHIGTKISPTPPRAWRSW